MHVDDVVAAIEDIAPLSGACAWDNSGVQVPGTRDDVRRVAATIDPAPDKLREALEWGADLVFTHHPLYIDPKPLSQPGYFLDAARAVLVSGAWLYAAHTSLDAQPGGPAGWLFRELGLTGLRVLEPTDPADTAVGIGFAGELPTPMGWEDFAARLGAAVDRDFWSLAGAPPERIRTVAYCTGSGSSLMGAAAQAGADVFVTGDMRYHPALETTVFTVDVGHFSLEERMTSEMADLLEARLAPQGVETRFFPGRDPLTVHLPTR